MTDRSLARGREGPCRPAGLADRVKRLKGRRLCLLRAEALDDGRSLIARRDERRGGQYLQSQQATETTYAFDATYGPATRQQSVYEQTTKAHVATCA